MILIVDQDLQLHHGVVVAVVHGAAEAVTPVPLAEAADGITAEADPLDQVIPTQTLAEVTWAVVHEVPSAAEVEVLVVVEAAQVVAADAAGTKSKYIQYEI